MIPPAPSKIMTCFSDFSSQMNPSPLQAETSMICILLPPSSETTTLSFVSRTSLCCSDFYLDLHVQLITILIVNKNMQDRLFLSGQSVRPFSTLPLASDCCNPLLFPKPTVQNTSVKRDLPVQLLLLPCTLSLFCFTKQKILVSIVTKQMEKTFSVSCQSLPRDQSSHPSP